MTHVTSIQLHRVHLPLRHRFQTSSHAKGDIEHILVRLEDVAGIVGWGEIASPSGPFYGPETVDTCWSIARDHLVPLTLAAEWEQPADLHGALDKVRGNAFARAGFDMAAWALHTVASGVPLARALGGTRDRVAAGVSLGIEPTIDDLLAQVQGKVDEGYHRVKLKIAPGWDAAPVRAVRDAFPRLAMHVDANGAYRPGDDTREVLRALDGLDLLMIEQPFAPHDLLSHARAQAMLATPVCLDESVETVDDLRTAIALRAGGILNIKVSRMGGLTEAVRAHHVAQDAGWPVWCGGMHEFGIGRAANVALSALPGFTLPSDVSGSDKYYVRDITTEPVVCRDGWVAVSDAPGLGWEPDLAFMAENTVAVHEAGDRL